MILTQRMDTFAYFTASINALVNAKFDKDDNSVHQTIHAGNVNTLTMFIGIVQGIIQRAIIGHKTIETPNWF